MPVIGAPFLGQFECEDSGISPRPIRKSTPPRHLRMDWSRYCPAHKQSRSKQSRSMQLQAHSIRSPLPPPPPQMHCRRRCPKTWHHECHRSQARAGIYRREVVGSSPIAGWLTADMESGRGSPGTNGTRVRLLVVTSSIADPPEGDAPSSPPRRSHRGCASRAKRPTRSPPRLRAECDASLSPRHHLHCLSERGPSTRCARSG